LGDQNTQNCKNKKSKTLPGEKKIWKKNFHQTRNQFLRKYGKKHKRGSKRGGGGEVKGLKCHNNDRTVQK